MAAAMTGPASSPGGAGEPAWGDPAFARAWAAADGLAEFLALPRAIAAAVVALDRPAPRLVVDVASGPGAFLGTFLQRFPAAQGIWLDASAAMLEQARSRLAAFSDRVEFLLGDLTDLSAAGVPDGADAWMTSRALHHLDRTGIAAFYRDATARLAPGGWLVNLDHVGLPGGWSARMRAVRPEFAPTNAATGSAAHRHPEALATVDDHLASLAAAGVQDPGVPWRALHVALMMGRTAST